MKDVITITTTRERAELLRVAAKHAGIEQGYWANDAGVDEEDRERAKRTAALARGAMQDIDDALIPIAMEVA